MFPYTRAPIGCSREVLISLVRRLRRIERRIAAGKVHGRGAMGAAMIIFLSGFHRPAFGLWHRARHAPVLQLFCLAHATGTAGYPGGRTISCIWTSCATADPRTRARTSPFGTPPETTRGDADEGRIRARERAGISHVRKSRRALTWPAASKGPRPLQPRPGAGPWTRELVCTCPASDRRLIRQRWSARAQAV